jgi:hypothetical protein
MGKSPIEINEAPPQPTSAAFEADLRYLVVRHLEAGRLERLETRKRDGDLVHAGSDELEVVLTLRFRDRVVPVLRADVDGDDRRAGNHASAAVGDGADQRGLTRQLRECAAVEQHGKPDG